MGGDGASTVLETSRRVMHGGVDLRVPKVQAVPSKRKALPDVKSRPGPRKTLQKSAIEGGKKLSAQHHFVAQECSRA